MKPKKVEAKNLTAVQKPTEVKNATKEFMNATEFKKVNESSAAQKNVSVSGTTKNVTNTTVKEKVVETFVNAQKNVSKNSTVAVAQVNMTKSVVAEKLVNNTKPQKVVSKQSAIPKETEVKSA